MFSFFSIGCIFAIIIKSYGNPVLNSSNVTDFDSRPQLLCDRNADLTNNSSLFEVNLKNRLFL
jgi:hypothetical protein